MNPAWIDVLPPILRNKLVGRQNLQKIIGNTGWLFADKILRMGVGLLVGVWVARYLGPEQFGIFSYAVAFVTLFSSLATLGLNDIAIRNLVNTPTLGYEILGTSFVLKLVAGIFSSLMATLTLVWLRPTDSLTFWLVFIISLGTIPKAFEVIDFWFQSTVQAKYTVISQNIAFIISSGLKIALILAQAPLIAFAIVSTIDIIMSMMSLALIYQEQGFSLKLWSWDFAQAKNLLKDSWPLILSTIMGMIYLRIDQIMLGEMSNETELGLYSAAVRLVEVWYFIPMAIYASVLPSIIEAQKTNEASFYDRLQKLYNFMAFLGYAIALPITFIAPWLIVTLFGQAYSGAAPMLILMIWSGLFTNLGVARSAFLVPMNWTKIHLVTVFLGAVSNVILNYFLIPKYGGLGASIATCISYWLAAHGACFVYPPLFKTGKMLTKALVYPKIW